MPSSSSSFWDPPPDLSSLQPQPEPEPGLLTSWVSHRKENVEKEERGNGGEAVPVSPVDSEEEDAQGDDDGQSGS